MMNFLGGWKGGLVLMALCALVLFWQAWELKAVRAQRDQALAAQERAEGALDDYGRAARLAEAALAAHERDVRELAGERDKALAELEVMYGRTCETKAWADTSVPADVLQRLRRPLPGPAADPDASGGISPFHPRAPTPGGR